MKFIHTADLHLDTPFRGLQIEDQQILKKIRNSTLLLLKILLMLLLKNK